MASATKVGIEGGDEGQPAEIDDDPQAEDHDMQIDKRHAAGEGADAGGDAVWRDCLAVRPPPSLRQRFDIAGEDGGHVLARRRASLGGVLGHKQVFRLCCARTTPWAESRSTEGVQHSRARGKS